MRLTSPMLAGSAACLLLLGCSAEQQRAEGVVVRRGGDLVGARGTIRVADSIPGDVMLTGSEVVFSGVTGGDYLGAAGDQRLSGTIHGSVRAAAGNVVVFSTIGRNATIAGGNVELREGSTIEGNAYLAGGNIVVAGTVRQLLRATGGAVQLTGTVGDVNVTAQRLSIGPRARIDGDVRYRVPAENVDIDSAASITGSVIALPTRDWAAAWRMVRIFWGLAFLVAGAVLVALLPAAATAASDGIRSRPAVAAGLGVMWVILVPIAAGLAAATIVGLPLAMILFGAYLIVLYLAGVVLALALGRLAIRDRAQIERGRLVLSFLLGGVVLILLSWIPVVGGFAVLLAIVLGSGALMMPVVRRTAA